MLNDNFPLPHNSEALNQQKQQKVNFKRMYFRRKNVKTTTNLVCETVLALWHFRNADAHFLFPVHSGNGRVSPLG